MTYLLPPLSETHVKRLLSIAQPLLVISSFEGKALRCLGFTKAGSRCKRGTSSPCNTMCWQHKTKDAHTIRSGDMMPTMTDEYADADAYGDIHPRCAVVALARLMAPSRVFDRIGYHRMRTMSDDEWIKFLRTGRDPQPKEDRMSDETAKIEMPEYVCHKKVHALRIAEITEAPDGGALITPEDTEFSSFVVNAAFMNKHNPSIGGYYVVYEDGYTSYSPSKAFEAGYSLSEVTKLGPEKKLPTFQQRVIQEKVDLDEKRIKLIAFMNTGTFMCLDDIERSDLDIQAEYMAEYSRKLGHRIQRFG